MNRIKASGRFREVLSILMNPRNQGFTRVEGRDRIIRCGYKSVLCFH